jgi:hypothetical protein
MVGVAQRDRPRPPSVGLELSPIDVRDAGELERAVTEFAH